MRVIYKETKNMKQKEYRWWLGEIEIRSFNFMRHGLPTFPNAVIMVDLGWAGPLADNPIFLGLDHVQDFRIKGHRNLPPCIKGDIFDRTSYSHSYPAFVEGILNSLGGYRIFIGRTIF